MTISEKDILASITAKSDQLNACDLLGGPITVRVESVAKGAADQPVCIGIGSDRQPYKPCKTMRRVLVDCWGANPNAWVGRRMTLFCDPTIKWGGEEVGGLRISHMSDIAKEKRVLVNVTKGKKGAIIVKPLATPVAPDVSDRKARFIAAINACGDIDTLNSRIELGKELIASLSDENVARVQEVIQAKRDEIGD